MADLKVDKSRVTAGLKDISIVIPTRDRLKNVRRLLVSMNGTTFSPDTLEVIFRLDNDDKDVHNYLKKCGAKFSLKVVKGKRNENLSDYWDECYKYANADRVMMCADDVVFRTPQWDKVVTEVMHRPKSRLHFCWGNDKKQGKHLATLPIMSRAWIEQCGFFVPCGYPRDWCDTHLHDIARRLRKLGHNRMIYLRDVVFEHMHPSCGKAKYDDTYKYRMALPGGPGRYNKRAKERQKVAQKLVEYIKHAGG